MKKELVLEPSTYSVDQAAAILGVSRKTLYDAITAGTTAINYVRIGRRILIPKAAVEAALKASAA